MLHKTKFKTGKEIKAEVVPHLSNIKVELIEAPSLEQLNQWVPQFTCAAWGDKPAEGDNYEALKDRAVDLMFEGKMLPTVLEGINLVFCVSGMDLTDATHLIRHRTLSFSAQALGDRDMREDRLLCKESILEDDEFTKRSQELYKQSLELYADMLDSGRVNSFDARTVLPRGMETYYYVRGNLKDILHMIDLRLDRHIHPQSDNIIAAKMYLELCKIYPQLIGRFDLHRADKFYAKVATSDVGHNIFPPNGLTAPLLEGKDIAPCTHPIHRDSYPGGTNFYMMMVNIAAELDMLKRNYEKDK